MSRSGVDEHAAVLDDRLAIAIALVIDEARVVAADGGVDHGVFVDDEQERVIVVLVVIFVTRIGRGVRHAIAEILEDARALGDRRDGEHAAAVHVGIAHFDERRSRDRRAAALGLRLVDMFRSSSSSACFRRPPAP